MTDFDGLGYRDATAVVVGCASGIGEATARILGDLGARVVAVSLHKPHVAYEMFFETDLGSTEQIDDTAAALRDVGPIDYLFCSSGVPVTLDPMQVMRVNYVGVRYLIEQALPSMIDGGNVAIVASNVARGWEERLPTLLEILGINDPVDMMQWLEAHPDVVADGYRLSKQLLVAWVASHAPSLGETRRIRLNCTAPGPTATWLVDETTKLVGDDFFDNFPYPVLGRIASPEEQAWPLILLNSRMNAAVTGAVLYADQGVAGGILTGAIEASAMTPAMRQPVE